MTKKININDEVVHICKSIWSSRTKEQMESCNNMVNTFTTKHAEHTGALMMLNIEVARQERLIKLMSRMGEVQKKLEEEQGKQVETMKKSKLEFKDGKIVPMK